MASEVFDVDEFTEQFEENSVLSEPKSSARKLDSGDDPHSDRPRSQFKIESHPVKGELSPTELPVTKPKPKRFADSRAPGSSQNANADMSVDMLSAYQPLPRHVGLSATHESVLILQRNRSVKDNFLLMLRQNGTDKHLIGPLSELLDNPHSERLEVHFGLLGYANYLAGEVFTGSAVMGGGPPLSLISKKYNNRIEPQIQREPLLLPKLPVSSNKLNSYQSLINAVGEEYFVDKYDTCKLLSRANYLRNIEARQRRMTKSEVPAETFRKAFLDSMRTRRGPITAANAMFFGGMGPVSKNTDAERQSLTNYQSFKFKMLSKENLRFIKAVVKHLIIDNYFSLESENACNSLSEPTPERVHLLGVRHYPYPLEKENKSKFLRDSLINHLTKRSLRVGPNATNPLKLRYSESGEPILHTSGDGMGGAHTKSYVLSKFKRTLFELGQLDFDRRSNNLYTERYVGIGMKPEYEGEFKKAKNQSFNTKYYRIFCCRFFWYSSVKDLKAIGYVDLLTANATLEERNGTDYLKLYPRSDKKEMLIIMDELGESLRENIIEVRAFYNSNSLIDTRIITSACRSDITFGSPVKFSVQYRGKYADRPIPKWCIKYPGFKYFNSLMHIKLVSVNITANILADFQDLIIKCVSLKVLELDNNNMTDTVSHTVFRCVSEWAIDKVKTLCIRNNKLSIEICRNLLYYVGLRVCYVLEHNSAVDRRYVSYGPLEMLAISNCGLQDSTIMDLKPVLVKYKQKTLLKLDISGNIFSDRGLGVLGDGIKRSRVISHLSIRDNKRLTVAGISEFLHDIRYNTSIQELDMRGISGGVLSQVSLRFLRFNQAIHRLRLDFDQEDFLKLDYTVLSLQLGGYRFCLTDEIVEEVSTGEQLEESLDEEAFWNIFSLVQKVMPEQTYQMEDDLKSFQFEDLNMDPLKLIQAVMSVSPRSKPPPSEV